MTIRSVHSRVFKRVLVAWVLGIGVAWAAQRGPGLTPEMVVALQRVTQVALSPDGAQIAYTLSVPRELDDVPGHKYSELWVVPAAGGNSRVYVASPDSAAAVRWSPDGTRLAFLGKLGASGDVTQIYQLPLEGGTPQPLTDHPTSIKAFEWSPDGVSMAYTAIDAASEQEQADKKAGRDWKVADSAYRYRRLWMLTLQTGKTRQLFKNDLNIWAFTWSPDGKSIAFQAATTPLVDDSYVFKQIFTVSARGGKPRVVTKTEGKLGSMAFSPDGKQLAYLGAVSLNDPLSQSLFTVPISGGKATNLTIGYEGSGVGVHWIDDQTLLLRANEGSQSALINLAEGGKAKTRVAFGGAILRALDISANGVSMAAVAHSPGHPSEVYAGTLAEGSLSPVTHHNPQLAGVVLATQEVVTWHSDDGQTIEGILTYPLGYRKGRRYPLVLQVHGGPEGVSLNGWNTSALYPVQILAGRGYMVLQPNYRGSGGRGVAFSKGDHDDLGGAEFQDILAGIDALVERGLVDGKRVGTGGWSYGGYMSAWAATRHSQRFKAAVVAAGLSNWISFAGTTDIPHEMSLVHWNSYWYDQPQLHWERSPLSHLNNARTPTLVVHGLKDERVHPEQSRELYTGLKLKGVPTQLVEYPREPHGLHETAHELDFIYRVVDWFDRYLK
ncbi:MAG: S9 family peptidase [Candidatus Marinimicrobia bacterium]|nr:S9 family peptidase [Candidatus Neomarinimicrobiota bacterium]